jgi:hypothetical protein
VQQSLVQWPLPTPCYTAGCAAGKLAVRFSPHLGSVATPCQQPKHCFCCLEHQMPAVGACDVTATHLPTHSMLCSMQPCVILLQPTRCTTTNSWHRMHWVGGPWERKGWECVHACMYHPPSPVCVCTPVGEGTATTAAVALKREPLQRRNCVNLQPLLAWSNMVKHPGLDNSQLLPVQPSSAVRPAAGALCMYAYLVNIHTQTYTLLLQQQ